MMTDDELDLLASSYLDGEATSDEVALVEGDPELQDRVAQLRAVRVTSVAAPAGLAQAQVARAMAAYVPGSAGVGKGAITGEAAVEPAASAVAMPETVVDLAERRRQREGRLRWLSSAAAVLVVGIGAVALINQIGAGDEDEMATAETEAETDTAASTVVAQAEMADESAADATGDDGAEAEMADESAADATGDDEAAPAGGEMLVEAEESADAEESLTLDQSDQDVDASAGAERTLRQLPESGFFPDEPAASYDRLPGGDEMVGDLELPWRDEAGASCLDAFPSDSSPYASDEVEVIAYLPFEVTDGDDAGVYEALYVIVAGAEEVVVVLRPDDCTPVSN